MKTNESGITLISLGIMIIVLIILASVATVSGISVMNSAKFTKFSTEMELMQAEVNKMYDAYKDKKGIKVKDDKEYIGDDILNLGTDISTVQGQADIVFKSEAEQGSGITDINGFKYYNKDLIKKLSIEGIDQEFFVNIKTRTIISYLGMKYYDKMYYTLDQLPNSSHNVQYQENTNKPTFDVNVEQTANNIWRVNVSNIQYNGNVSKWYIGYKQVGQDANKISEEYSFEVYSSAKYTIQVYNDNMKSDEKEIQVFNRTKVNSPKLSKGMIPVKYNGTNWVVCSEKDIEWFNYIDQSAGTDLTSKWANIMLSDGTYKEGTVKIGQVVQENELGSMYVWIPRYAYAITSNYHTNSTTGGTIKVAFLEGTKEYKVGDTISYTYQGNNESSKLVNASGQGNLNEHPAFNYGGTVISGIWISKFEASSENPTATNGGDNVTNLKIKSLPNVPSWRGIQVSNIYTNCINMNNTTNATFYGMEADDTKIDPHMMKNSEWGAIAYLTQSSYGRNGNDIYINNNSNYITGISGGSTSASQSASIENSYTTVIGQKASTTGNISGIYDLSGGAWECVAGYVDNSKPSLITYGSSLVNSSVVAHKDVYTTTSDSSTNNYNQMSVRYGNAVYETSNSYDSGFGTWHGKYSVCPSNDSQFFARGSHYSHTSQAGVFSFSCINGNTDSTWSFRSTLISY